MARIATPLNIPEQPAVGCAYVIKDRQTKKFIRCSSTCNRDILRGTIKVIRQFSGSDPFFTAKVGSYNTEVEVIKFLCGVQHKKCLSECEKYEWLNLTLPEARKQKIEFSEPGYVAVKETPVKVAKTKKVKSVKAPKKVKVAKVSATKAKSKSTKRVSAVETKPEFISLPTTLQKEMTFVDEAPQHETPAVEVAETSNKPVEQSDAEFEASVNEEWEKATSNISIAQ